VHSQCGEWHQLEPRSQLEQRPRGLAEFEHRKLLRSLHTRIVAHPQSGHTMPQWAVGRGSCEGEAVAQESLRPQDSCEAPLRL